MEISNDFNRIIEMNAAEYAVKFAKAVVEGLKRK